MPFEIEYEHIPVGICMEAKPRGSTTAKVLAIEFVSTEDGDVLTSRLDAWGSEILSKLPAGSQVPPGAVDHLLAIIRRDRTATVYLNELQMIREIQIKRPCEKGDPIFADDIADLHRVKFQDVNIPENCGIIYIFSVGWRRGIFYDLLPLNPREAKSREYDVEVLLAQFHSYLLFQERFKVSDDQWRALFDGQWFPFVSLKNSTIRSLLEQAANNWPLDDLVPVIANEVRSALPNFLRRWKNIPSFADHIPFLEQAAQRYDAGDHISTTAILYPRLEGLMRSHQRSADPSGKASQKGLAGSTVKHVAENRHASTLLLPGKFNEYIEKVYFAGFDPNASKISISRNSVGHGVVQADECSLKAATISVLLVDQLAFYFSAVKAKVASATAPVSPTDADSAIDSGGASPSASTEGDR
jgi:hypothetical protein